MLCVITRNIGRRRFLSTGLTVLRRSSRKIINVILIKRRHVVKRNFRGYTRRLNDTFFKTAVRASLL